MIDISFPVVPAEAPIIFKDLRSFATCKNERIEREMSAHNIVSLYNQWVMQRSYGTWYVITRLVRPTFSFHTRPHFPIRNFTALAQK